MAYGPEPMVHDPELMVHDPEPRVVLTSCDLSPRIFHSIKKSQTHYVEP